MFDVTPLRNSCFCSAPTSAEAAPAAVGRSKGIQGKNNSCYVDVSLMAMFAFNDVFDVLLIKPPSPEPPSVHTVTTTASKGRAVPSEAVTFFQQFLVMMIVNPMRRDGFVPFAHIMTLRSMMSELLEGTHGDSFVRQAATEDVNLFLERLQQVLCGGTGGAPPVPPPTGGGASLNSIAHQLLNVVVATAPVMNPLTGKQREVVSVEGILRASGAYPTGNGSAQYRQPLWVNVPRCETGELPYKMILPTLWLVQPQEESRPPPTHHLELSAIVTYDVTIQHYGALLKLPPLRESSASVWVDYDSMGDSALNDATGATEQVPRILSAGSLQIFEACARNPILETMCCDVFGSDDFINFMYAEVSLPMRSSPSVVNEWIVFRKAVRRPYLYLYLPKEGPVPSVAQQTLNLEAVKPEKIPLLIQPLTDAIIGKRSWQEAISFWHETHVVPLQPPPVSYGCPDCGAAFASEQEFVVHMQRQNCQPPSHPHRREASGEHAHTHRSAVRDDYSAVHSPSRGVSSQPAPSLSPGHQPPGSPHIAPVASFDTHRSRAVPPVHYPSKSVLPRQGTTLSTPILPATFTAHVNEYQCIRCHEWVPMQSRTSHRCYLW